MANHPPGASRAALIPSPGAVVQVEGVLELFLLVGDLLQVAHLAVAAADFDLVLGKDGLPAAAALRLGYREYGSLGLHLPPVVHHGHLAVVVHEYGHTCHGV
eukprot:CAMPEP_0197914860 /NCGR_PEP_ID=MMETSP1439-20131203/79242_1 /TAXON_ID=66791 /ORGANISM="Gonyaulax spinifera, Strain CCMP409" /LENGTH=101 /DNA_ID=CAMNT_0043536785 /DNA_START=316 /DNA_END=617 /DNA_ORIENTATION=+